MKKKLICAFILIIAVVAFQTISAQSGFLSNSFTNSLVETAGNLMESNNLVVVEQDDLLKAESDKMINGLPVAFELFIKIEATQATYFDDGKYLSGLYVDDSGVYDIANGSYFDSKHYLREEPKERFIIEGTKQGKFYLILTLSNEVPYFGDFLNETFNNEILGRRYVENALKEIERVNADVFVLEIDSSSL